MPACLAPASIMFCRGKQERQLSLSYKCLNLIHQSFDMQKKFLVLKILCMKHEGITYELCTSYNTHTCSTSCPDNPVSSLILCFRRLLAVDSKSFFFSNRAFGKLSGNWPLLKKRFCKSKFPFLNLCNRVSQSKTYLRKCLQTLVMSLPTRLALGSNTTVTSMVHEFTVDLGNLLNKFG